MTTRRPSPPTRWPTVAAAVSCLPITSVSVEIIDDEVSEVAEFLCSTSDERIFASGDCAAVRRAPAPDAARARSRKWASTARRPGISSF
ncbi:hypothetical protein AB0H42_34110 [Nocardia sp. NPDC050799]|uniref:hypothetical protein n=1 Tax=Nocardia sp. NPDC050799 TaxID=3154842 RepID=UPI0033E76C48